MQRELHRQTIPSTEGKALMALKPRILLVDDSEIILEGLKCFLNQKYEVVTANNGVDALGEFESNLNRLDLVITDLVMPLVSGVGVVSSMKQQSPRTPIIAITGWGQETTESATKLKADMVLMKPFDLEELDLSVSRLLSTKH